MKDKVKTALVSLREAVEDHEAETEFSAVTVDLGDLKRLLRWAQNEAHVWFIGDRVGLTGARVPFNWLTQDMHGTVIEESHEDGRARVEWDSGPEDDNRVWMFHNEIKKLK